MASIDPRHVSSNPAREWVVAGRPLRHGSQAVIARKLGKRSTGKDAEMRLPRRRVLLMVVHVERVAHLDQIAHGARHRLPPEGK